MKRKKINSKSLAIIFSTLLLFTISLFLIFDPNYHYSNKIDKTEVLEGAEDDNWEISTVFYDSTVNNGNTPLTEINWDADDRYENRVIKVQINYKNTNTQKKYSPNQLKIYVDRFRGRNRGNTGNNRYGINEESVSAGSLENGYDWFKYNTSVSGKPVNVFQNNITVEENSNLEGSIQIVYNLKPFTKFDDLYNDPDHNTIYASTFLNNEPEVIKAKLIYGDKEVESNELIFNFNATKTNYTVTKTATEVKALDGFENPNDYVWIRYYSRVSRIDNHPRNAHLLYFEEEIPTGAVAYDSNLQKVEVNNNRIKINYEDEQYVEDNTMDGNSTSYFIGYPKVSLEGQTITSTVELYGTYDDELEPSKLAEASKTIDLSQYEFNYTGELYKLDGYYTSIDGTLAKYDYDVLDSYITPKVVYTGLKYDLIVGADYLWFPTEDGTYKKLDDNEYHIKNVILGSNGYMGNGNLAPIVGNEVVLFVRYKNTEEYVEYPEKMELGSKMSLEFDEDNIVDVITVIKDLECGIGWGSIKYNTYIHAPDMAETGKAYVFPYMKVKHGDEILSTPTSASSYPQSNNNGLNLAQYDLDTYGNYVQRAAVMVEIYENRMYYSVSTNYSNLKNYPNEEVFKMDYEIRESIDYYSGKSDSFSGTELLELLPEGMNISITEEDLRSNIESRFKTVYSRRKFKLSSGKIFDNVSESWDYFNSHLDIDIIENYNNSNRTFLRIKYDFTDVPFVISPAGREFSYPNDFTYRIPVTVSYDSYLEHGNEWNNEVYGFIIDQAHKDYKLVLRNGDTYHGTDINDINNNGDISEEYYVYKNKTNIYAAIETHQDVQTSVQSEISNFDTGKVNVSKNGEYTYKLRVRTGQNEVTNLIIYDSIEDYAKNPQLEIVKASGGKHYWQGEFQGVDTSYAESKGYQIKTYYNTNPNPGTLAEDNTWQEYTDSVDKSKVKALAFKYLDGSGNPAILPANTNTYVLLKMKSPNEDFKTFTYNGCWTEWNAIDSVTGRPVDFITGINSNIVKVALPTSVEPEDINITIKKEWKDGNNTLGVRPNTINVKLIANDDYTNAVEVPMTGTGNSWTTTVTVPRYDEDGETITYTVKEDNITVGEYHYSSTTNNYTITNSLNKDITLTKVWKDNTNAYLTRPSNVTFKIKQNNNDYKTVTFGGNLTDNEWTETVTVPVYDNNGTAYNYTVEEINVSNYSSTCTEFTCTNTLTGNDNITVKKVWVDNNNEYQTRPNNISIRLKQNGNAYQSIDLTGTTNTWTSDEITVPMYDNEGVKYTYTVEETPISGYGIVEYNQADLKVTNTLKENKAITVTKKWIDNSNELGLRPNELKINLLQNGNNYQEITLSGDTDTWSTTIEVPKYDNNQHEYTYSIKELVENINDDYSNISYSEEELSVTNKLEAKTNITISKTWDDNDNELKTRPESIIVNLLRNGEQYEELEIIPDDISDNTWSVTVEDLDVYDSNGAKYTYTIEESLIDQLERYETITYDQTNFKITNKLTVPPKVTLYFTVKNGYTLPGTEEVLYDQEGYNDVLSRYNLNGEDEYIFTFELENIDTGEIIEGKLSTQGTLEFDDVPYGTYRAREGEDDYFSFVSMIEIEEVLGVTFTEDEMGGTISITPTGKDIIYGANITNKIEIPPKNPETKTNNNLLIISIIILTISLLLGITVYKKFSFLKA